MLGWLIETSDVKMFCSLTQQLDSPVNMLKTPVNFVGSGASIVLVSSEFFDLLTKCLLDLSGAVSLSGLSQFIDLTTHRLPVTFELGELSFCVLSLAAVTLFAVLVCPFLAFALSILSLPAFGVCLRVFLSVGGKDDSA